MEVGALGHHGGVAAFLVEMELRQEQENVTVPHLPMVEKIAEGHTQIIKHATTSDVHMVRKFSSVNVSYHGKDGQSNLKKLLPV